MVAPLCDFAVRRAEARSWPWLQMEPRRLAIYDQTVARIDAEAVRAFQQKHALRLQCYKPAALEKYADIAWFIADKTRIAVRFDLDRKTNQAILDIGSGAGHFLAVCAALGHRAVGVDVDEPFYAELSSLLNVERRIMPVVRQTRLPHLGRRFDLITIIFQTFDRIAIHADGTREHWSISDWAFFHQSLVSDQLAQGGRIYLELNKERQKDAEAFNVDLLKWYRSIGADVEAELGIIIVSP
jgi:SAM-dependent methyltransferase